MSGATSKYAIPYFSGSDIGNTIDDTDNARAMLLDSIIATADRGAASARPVSTSASPGKSGRFYWSMDTVALDYDYGTGWIRIALAETADFTAVTSISIPVAATTKLLSIEFAIQTTALPELVLVPNSDTSPVYSDVRDGSWLTSDGVAHDKAASQTYGYAHGNGMRVASPPQGANVGGATFAGRTSLALGGAIRTCVTQCSAVSLIGSANQVVEVQNTAATYGSNTSISFVTLGLHGAGGTMSGRVRYSTV